MFKLKKLYANQATFHTVEFKDGVNIVLGIQQNSKEKGKTTNGIGKSLILRFIDFCLGSNVNKKYEKPLAGWSFFLEYEIDDQNFIVQRDIDNQKEVIVNNETMKLTAYKEMLHRLMNIDNDFSFRNVLTRFLRIGKKAFTNYQIVNPDNSYQNSLTLAYLLKLDYHLCKEKDSLMDKIEKTSTMAKSAKNDPAFRTIFGIKGDIALELSEIEFEIDRLTNELAQYKVAENYAEIEERADEYSTQIDDLQNEIFIVKNRIENIEVALNRSVDIELEKVYAIYREVGAAWSQQLNQNIEAVVEFHKTLIAKRHEQLNKDLVEFNKVLQQRITELKEKQDLLDQQIQFLQSHKAIDKYIAVNNKIKAYQADKDRLKKYANLEKELKEKLASLRQELTSSDIETQRYLNSKETYLADINKRFTELAKEFFPDKRSAFTIKNNDSNKSHVRFNFDARIESDGSDGIQEVVIFCFDWLLAMLNDTKQGFIYHDSLLLSNVEVRQRQTIFKLIKELCQKTNMQYIININQDQLNGFEEEIKGYVFNNKILELTDKDASSKLLGIEVDLQEELKE
jgi:uncharacterized protein YydD (DUF2326 family)